MRKKFFIGMAALAVGLVIMVQMNFCSLKSDLLDVTLESVEALAQIEGGDLPEVIIICSKQNCNGGLCHKYVMNDPCACHFTGNTTQNCIYGK